MFVAERRDLALRVFGGDGAHLLLGTMWRGHRLGTAPNP